MGDIAAPRPSVVKRLFGLSGNRCAFPNCTLALIDDAGCVTGEICHIHARSPNGPRYEPLQTAEERHAFDNLILMCPQHHKRIDEAPEEFTAARLKTFKTEHEARKLETPPPSDAIIQALLEKLRVDVRAGDNSIVAGRDITIIQTGITYEDARAVALDVFRANALELAGIAQAVARDRAEAVTKQFLDKLFGDNAGSEAKDALADPDMQHALFEAQKAAARSGNKELTSVLADLLVDRAKAQVDIQKIVLNEAISVAAKLTPDQCDALSIMFILRYTRTYSVRSTETLKAFLQERIVPLLATASRTLPRYQHLQYAGCIGTQTFALPLEKALASAYPHIAFGDLDRDEVARGLSVDVTNVDALLGHVFVPADAGKLRVLGKFDTEYLPELRRAGIPDEICQRLQKFIAAKAQDGFKQILPNLHPRMNELTEFWKKYGSAFTLTSVGIAIAHSNLRRRGLGEYDLSVWIN
jgi:hypothetical protein